MMDWSLQRRALWLYHHQNTIDSQLYATQMQNAQLSAEINRLKASGLAPKGGDYVDNEYAENPDLMYSEDYVKAAYNPAPVQRTSGGWTVLWVLLGIGGLVLVIWLIFFKDWGRN